MSKSNNLNAYTIGSADWRKTLRQNNRHTFYIIVLFFLIYLGIGILVDLYLDSSSYPQASISDLLAALFTFQIFPLATIIMFIVATISLLVSFALHDRLMLLGTEYHEVTPENVKTRAEQQLYNVIEEMRIAAGLRYMPRVYIIDADYMNAFASGYSERSAMVAITRGLMEKLNRDELQAVMAHELSHIRHLDIKVTLFATLLANMILIVLDIMFYNTMYARSGNSENRSRNSLAGLIILLRYLLPIVSTMLILYLSRTRELMADAGSVQLTRNNEPLASALLKIQGDHVQNREAYNIAYQQTPHENIRRESYIFDPTQAGITTLRSISDLFSTHPSLEKRLAALGIKLKQQ